MQICPSSTEVNLGGTTIYTSSFNFPCEKTFFMSNCFKIIEARERRNLIVVIFAIGEKVSCSQCRMFVCIPLSLILFYIFQQSNVLLLFIPMSKSLERECTNVEETLTWGRDVRNPCTKRRKKFVTNVCCHVGRNKRDLIRTIVTRFKLL